MSTPYRTAPLVAPPARRWWQRLFAPVLRWYWTRYGDSDDYRHAEVREAIGGEWEQVWPYFGRGLLPWERTRDRPPFELEWHPRVPDDVGMRCYGRWRLKGSE